MKISSQIQSLYTNNVHKHFAVQPKQQQILLCENPAKTHILQKDVVSFKRNNDYIYISDMRELPHLNCACCDVEMLKNSEVNKFLNKKIYYPASISLQKIKTEKIFNEKKASASMLKAYKYLRSYANKNPKLSMEEILARLRNKNIEKNFPQDVIDSFSQIRDLTKLVAHNSKYMIDELNKLNPDFHKLEKKVFKELKKLAQEYPDETFYSILNKPQINKKYLTALQHKEMVVLDNILKETENETPEFKTKINELVQNARLVFSVESVDIMHKRGRVIESFKEFLSTEPDKTKAAKILKLINQLPDSKTDVDAFMIKGAQKNSNAIIEILINRLRNTREHVKPHHRVNDNGPSTIYNYICLCGKCNTERKRTEYDIFIQSHPEMPKNTQKQLNKIIYYVNSGILRKHDDYPEKIKIALDKESKGLINVDISNLNLSAAKANRKLRQDIYIEEKRIKQMKEEMHKRQKFYFNRTGRK